MRPSRNPPMRSITFLLPVTVAAVAEARAQAEGRSLGNYLRRIVQAAQEPRAKDPAAPTPRKQSPELGA